MACDGFPVVVVGGGTVGLAVALLLSAHGTTPLVVGGAAARAEGAVPIGVRAGEVLRQVGVAGLLGRDEDLDDRVSPVAAGHWPAGELDDVLRELTSRHGVTVLPDTSVTGVDQDDRGVTVGLDRPLLGVGDSVRTDYLVVADRVAGRQGRVFFTDGLDDVGPGIVDGHNLAWKLAAVLDGTAGDGLLDSYEQERRSAPSRLDHRYRSDAVVAGPPTDRDAFGAAGTRAPHLPIELDGEPMSTLDLFGNGFVLLADAAGGGPWRAAAGAVSSSRTARVLPYLIGSADATGIDVVDTRNRWPDHSWPGAAMLVRPDGIVAWRGHPGAGHRRTLGRAVAQILDRRVNSLAHDGPS
jgi:hypothetical protein